MIDIKLLVHRTIAVAAIFATTSAARAQQDDTAADKTEAKPVARKKLDLATADVCQLLQEARDVYLEDGAGKKANPRRLSFVWQREDISHSPLLHIAVGLAMHDDAQAFRMAKAIDDAACAL